MKQLAGKGKKKEKKKIVARLQFQLTHNKNGLADPSLAR